MWRLDKMPRKYPPAELRLLGRQGALRDLRSNPALEDLPLGHMGWNQRQNPGRHPLHGYFTAVKGAHASLPPCAPFVPRKAHPIPNYRRTAFELYAWTQTLIPAVIHIYASRSPAIEPMRVWCYARSDACGRSMGDRSRRQAVAKRGAGRATRA